MPGRWSDAIANAILDQLLGSGFDSALMPATVYVGLSSTEPTNTGGNITEVSGPGYARVAVTNNTTNFPAASTRQKSNGTAVTFPQPTGSWVAGAPLYPFLMTAASGGTYKGKGDAANGGANLTIDATNAPPSFAAGQLVFTFPGT